MNFRQRVTVVVGSRTGSPSTHHVSTTTVQRSPNSASSPREVSLDGTPVHPRWSENADQHRHHLDDDNANDSDHLPLVRTPPRGCGVDGRPGGTPGRPPRAPPTLTRPCNRQHVMIGQPHPPSPPTFDSILSSSSSSWSWHHHYHHIVQQQQQQRYSQNRTRPTVATPDSPNTNRKPPRKVRFSLDEAAASPDYSPSPPSNFPPPCSPRTKEDSKIVGGAGCSVTDYDTRVLLSGWVGLSLLEMPWGTSRDENSISNAIHEGSELHSRSGGETDEENDSAQPISEADSNSSTSRSSAASISSSSSSSGTQDPVGRLVQSSLEQHLIWQQALLLLSPPDNGGGGGRHHKSNLHQKRLWLDNHDNDISASPSTTTTSSSSSRNDMLALLSKIFGHNDEDKVERPLQHRLLSNTQRDLDGKPGMQVAAVAARGHLLRGFVHVIQGRLSQALEEWRRAIRLVSSVTPILEVTGVKSALSFDDGGQLLHLPCSWPAAVLLGNMGVIQYHMRDYPSSVQLLEESLAMTRSLLNSQMYSRPALDCALNRLVITMNNLAVVLLNVNRYDHARNYIMEAVFLHESIIGVDDAATCDQRQSNVPRLIRDIRAVVARNLDHIEEVDAVNNGAEDEEQQQHKEREQEQQRKQQLLVLQNGEEAASSTSVDTDETASSSSSSTGDEATTDGEEGPMSPACTSTSHGEECPMSPSCASTSHAEEGPMSPSCTSASHDDGFTTDTIMSPCSIMSSSAAHDDRASRIDSPPPASACRRRMVVLPEIQDYLSLGPLAPENTAARLVHRTVLDWLLRVNGGDDVSHHDNDNYAEFFMTHDEDEEEQGDCIGQRWPGCANSKERLSLRTCQRRAMRYVNRERYDEAADLFHRALHKSRTLYSSSSSDDTLQQQRAKVQGALWHCAGTVQLLAKKYKAAHESFQQAVKIRLAAFGANHANVHASLMKLGLAQLALGNCDRAQDTFWDVRDHFLDVSGFGHPHFAKIMNNIGVAAYEAGDLSGAVRSLELAHQYLRRRHEDEDDDHNDDCENNDVAQGSVSLPLAITLGNLAFVCFKEGQRLQALHFYEEAAAALQGQHLQGYDDQAKVIADNIHFVVHGKRKAPELVGCSHGTISIFKTDFFSLVPSWTMK